MYYKLINLTAVAVRIRNSFNHFSSSDRYPELLSPSNLTWPFPLVWTNFVFFCASGTVFMGAPEEWGVWQNLDNFWTNVKVLSIFCQTFVQVLSMSNICQNISNFTKFCQIFVQVLSMSNICQNILNFTKFCQIIVHNLS